MKGLKDETFQAIFQDFHTEIVQKALAGVKDTAGPGRAKVSHRNL